ncbi:MAG: RHS repeat-associated core domain-containing protein, partial [Paludibacteraceae bacterium]|nr:RHS repeat-associated core domain-containing protein [Paludibacteraceae bacterium]
EPLFIDSVEILYQPDMLGEVVYKNGTNNGKENKVYFYHPDHLGSASWITNKDADIVAEYQYAPYGELIYSQQSGYDERYKFTGKERDGETGYDYFGARYFWSALGIFISSDPLSYKHPELSSYAYCANNPIKYVDPDGRDPVKAAPDAIMGTPKYYPYREKQYQTFHKTTTPQAYYMSYGYKYATKFNNNSKNFSPKGQQWVQEVMLNLQLAMERRLVKEDDGTDLELNDENKFIKFAFKSHVDAYWNEEGAVPFYDLEITDYWQIFQTIDFKDLVSPEGVKQEVKLGGRYVKYEAGKIQKAITEYLQTLQQNINSMISNEKQQ